MCRCGQGAQKDPEGYRVSAAVSERWRNKGDISHIIAVRTGKYKYIWDQQRPDRSKLYDLFADPLEQHNIRSDAPAVAQELHAIVEDHLQRATPVTRPYAVAEPVHD